MTRSIVIPCVSKRPSARSKKAVALAFFSSGRILVQANLGGVIDGNLQRFPVQTLTTSATVDLTMPVSGDALQLFGIDSKQFDDLPDKTKDFMSGLRAGEVDTLDDGIRVDLWMLSDWSSLSRYHRGQNSD